MGKNERHLLRDLPERIGAVADCLSIACEKHLSHEDAVDPHLMSGPPPVPEAAVSVPGIFHKSVADCPCSDPVLRTVCLFIHEYDRITGEEIIKRIRNKVRNVSAVVYLLIDIPFDIIEIPEIACRPPHLFHGKHHITGLPAEVKALADPVNAVRVGDPGDEALCRRP